eukprot:CAMPEP_0204826366 /NCGR_PEP_ID=MMETSP1346-20131115/4065_1 /ASSEMBLY_ACC=CAM_ASM_000771 /TAXON_ID=215587 /ORGANISM="Aplanochytrium stocchinoi, Strain GSBS06" /LENGTH=225 /DNA_ID=CAMNT_0051954353 /DNA_START=215 /DNA_END=889 /DNA_ORIENTATION=-
MTGSTSNQNAGTGTESTPSNLNNADGWKGQSMQYRCECEFCKTGKATTHNDPSHDQSLYQKLDLSPAQDPALLQLTVFGGTTKCARIISKFLEEGEGFGRAYFENKKVVEVGSGTGLVGIVLGIIGANVVLTDQAPVLELLQENIEHNLNDPKFDREVCGKFDVHELYWGSSKVPEIVQNADVIIGSDLIFAKENIPLLLTTFETLCSPEKNTELIFAHIDRFSW